MGRKLRVWEAGVSLSSAVQGPWEIMEASPGTRYQVSGARGVDPWTSSGIGAWRSADWERISRSLGEEGETVIE